MPIPQGALRPHTIAVLTIQMLTVHTASGPKATGFEFTPLAIPSEHSTEYFLNTSMLRMGE